MAREGMAAGILFARHVYAVAAAAQRNLESRGLESERAGEGEYRFLCTGEADSFRELGTRFLQMPLGVVETVELPAEE
jgi:glutamate racemase